MTTKCQEVFTIVAKSLTISIFIDRAHVDARATSIKHPKFSITFAVKTDPSDNDRNVLFAIF